MADPATLAMVAMVGGTVMGGISQYQAGKEQAAQYKMNALIAAKKAAIAKQQAEQARRISREAGLEKRKEKRAAIARAIVLYAKSGMKAGIGTAPLVGGEIERRMEREAQIIQERGVAEWQYGMSQADIFRTQVGYFKKAAKAAKRRGLWSMGATLATGLSSAALLRYKFTTPATKTLSTARVTSGVQWKTSPWISGRSF